MATNFYAAARSGGKIVNRRRRKFTTATPYDRPPPSPRPPESPNWLTGLVFPATRTIVSGAAKLLTSVFNSDSSSCSSSSSSSSPSDDDEDDIKDDNDNDKHSEWLKEDTGTSSKKMKCAVRDAEQNEGMSKSKHLIEQLVMRETFSRVECDRLIDLINSRVVDSSTLDYGLRDAIPIGTAVTGTLDPCSQAVMEAREWLEDKKDDLHSVASFTKGNCGSSSFLTENMEKVDGSPIYVAKSYMKARPPWASPTENIDIRTPSSINSKLFKEGPPFSVGDYSMPSSRKRNSFSSGSWNICEEIRRVRSRATDDMLRSLPSKKIELPLLAEQKMKQNAVIEDTALTTLGDRARDYGSLADLFICSTPALGTDISLSEIRQDAGKSVTVPLNSPALIPQEEQDNDRVKIAGECAASESHRPSGPVFATENLDDPQSNNTSGSKEMANGVRQSMEDSLWEDGGMQKEDERWCGEGKCEFLSEASIEVPNVNEISILPTHPNT